MGMCRGRSHSNIIAVRLFFPSWFTPGYIHAIMLFSKANHFCILHPIAHKYMGTFPVTRVGFELHSALLNKTSLCGLRGLLCLHGSWLGVSGGDWNEWSLTSARATSTLAWVTQLLISAVLPCSQISPCGSVSPGVNACHCKELDMCFTESLSIWILQLWVIWFCYEYYGLLGRVKSRSPAPIFYHFWIRPLLVLACLYHYKWEKKPPYRLHFCSLPRCDFSWCLWRWNCCNKDRVGQSFTFLDWPQQLRQ